LTFVSAVAAGAVPISVAIDPTGQFVYAVNFNSNDVSAYTVGTSGALIAVPGSPFATGTQPHAIAID
jgi:6-phosphogluconolactonase (cycloisomerase 2 family)